MDDQGVRRAVGIFSPCDVAPLQTLVGVNDSILIGGLGLCHPLKADAKARVVHHCEHGAHAFMFFAQQIAGCAVVVHHTGCIAVDAHFFLDRADRHAVSRPERAVLVYEYFGNNEKRDALDPFRAAGDLGQDQMNDVVGHVVFARRDEDLLTADLVSPVALGLGLGAHHAQISAALGLGQVHGACPFTVCHLRQIFCLLFRAAVFVDRSIGAVGQPLIHCERLIGGIEHLADRCPDDAGHALSAIFRIAGKAGPFRLTNLIERRLEPGGGVDDAIFQTAALPVANDVEGGQNLGCDFADFFQHRRGEIRVQFLVSGDVTFGDFQNIMQHEGHVFCGGGIGRHGQGVLILQFWSACTVFFRASFLLMSQRNFSPSAIWDFNSSMAADSSSRRHSMSESRRLAISSVRVI